LFNSKLNGQKLEFNTPLRLELVLRLKLELAEFKNVFGQTFIWASVLNPVII